MDTVIVVCAVCLVVFILLLIFSRKFREGMCCIIEAITDCIDLDW